MFGSTTTGALSLCGLEYDDVCLLPSQSNWLPNSVCTDVHLGDGIALNTPVLSSPMDTITESRMAMGMADSGGLGIIHKNMSIDNQISEIEKVKKSEVLPIHRHTRGMNKSTKLKDILLKPAPPSSSASTCGEDIMLREEWSTVDSGTLYFRNIFCMKMNYVCMVPELTIENTIGDVVNVLGDSQVVRVVDPKSKSIVGIISTTLSDREHCVQSLDRDGRRLVGVAVSPTVDTVSLGRLINSDADVLVVDSAHGGHSMVHDALRRIKENSNHNRMLKHRVVIGGNAGHPDIAQSLSELCDIVKVGVGVGSVCTTSTMTGIRCHPFGLTLELSAMGLSPMPRLLVDGGIKTPGDICKALSAGATCVMLGDLLAGAPETPGVPSLDAASGSMVKQFRGMGSVGAMSRGSSDRYGRSMSAGGKHIPEGIERVVPMKGSCRSIMFEINGAIRSCCGYSGVSDINQLRDNPHFCPKTPMGVLGLLELQKFKSP